MYETAPWGYKKQPKFLNMVCVVETLFSPEQLLKELKRIERSMGRKPGFRHGPRLIDLDILIWGRRVITTPDLTIPHPSLHLREFVLRPLSELDRELFHPVIKKTVGELLEILERASSPSREANPEFPG
ncbi:hypothetical protein AMJ40_00435 [candidate division TA06 bacterium DG_26]|uniref:2-amino-4-hydroxy-6-hydroxymethyldihydropteridine diphosphokinase n=1 Tax=candidate division TA06 bacterium DG_26 TaxID=1703771 RepID=A0A0S7WMB8_UNCT6|nr:MAG: hypothetical protein AMJ40_00435 [candidate division TA06 bacterium DG_26]